MTNQMQDQADLSTAANGSLSVTYEIDEACFIRACHALWTYRAIGRFGNFVVAGGIGLCGAFLIWLEVAGFALYLLFVCVALLVALTLLRDLFWRRYYRKLEKYRGPITTIISDDSIEVILPQGSYTVQWSTFSSYLRTDEFLLLVISQRQFSIIPLSAFITLATAAHFERLVADHLPPMKKCYF
ncbi:MAG: YcxB family protein [bacterium]|nr:YcxB family protein [bacterium]